MNIYNKCTLLVVIGITSLTSCMSFDQISVEKVSIVDDHRNNKVITLYLQKNAADPAGKPCPFAYASVRLNPDGSYTYFGQNYSYHPSIRIDEKTFLNMAKTLDAETSKRVRSTFMTWNKEIRNNMRTP